MFFSLMTKCGGQTDKVKCCVYIATHGVQKDIIIIIIII